MSDRHTAPSIGVDRVNAKFTSYSAEFVSKFARKCYFNAYGHMKRHFNDTAFSDIITRLKERVEAKDGLVKNNPEIGAGPLRSRVQVYTDAIIWYRGYQTLAEEYPLIDALDKYTKADKSFPLP